MSGRGFSWEAVTAALNAWRGEWHMSDREAMEAALEAAEAHRNDPITGPQRASIARIKAAFKRKEKRR